MVLKRNSMSVILSQQDEKKWLNPDLKESTESDPLLKPYTASVKSKHSFYQLTTTGKNPRTETLLSSPSSPSIKEGSHRVVVGAADEVKRNGE